MSERVQPIRSELLAAKLEKVWNFELPELLDEFTLEPRLIQALWFLEYVSKPQNYAGGLTKFAEDFLSACAEQIGTPTMLRLGTVSNYRLEDAVAIMKELRDHDREDLLGKDAWIFENAFPVTDEKSDRFTVERVICDYSFFSDRENELETWSGSRKALVKVLLSKLTPATAKERCTTYVASKLATYLKELCELPHLGFRPKDAPTYFEGISQALLGFIELRAQTLCTSLAETEVTRLVQKWMKTARATGESVMIIGNTRFGKSEAVKLLCAVDPGSYRLIETPGSNATGDLLREVAKSLGIETEAKNNIRELRERIEYVLQFSRLTCVFDEAHFLFPTVYSRTTAPARLNWVRRAIMDRGLAPVFVCTPQNYNATARRFANRTGFVMEQFEGRFLSINLPDELCEADLLSVARIHFDSNLSDDYLQLVVSAALATERNYLSDVRRIAVFAKYNAVENGRQKPILEDIEAAIAHVLPALTTPAGAAPNKKRKTPTVAPSPGPCRPVAQVMQTPVETSSDLPMSRLRMNPLVGKPQSDNQDEAPFENPSAVRSPHISARSPARRHAFPMGHVT